MESYIGIWENINLSNDTAYIFAKSEELKDKMLNVTLEQLILAKTFEERKLVPTFGSLYATKAEHLDEEIDKFFNSLTNLKQLSPSGKFLSSSKCSIKAFYMILREINSKVILTNSQTHLG